MIIYINWAEESIIKEDEYAELLQEKKEEYMEDSDEFEDWLMDRYDTPLELWRKLSEFSFDESAIYNEYEEYCKNMALSDVEDEWVGWEI